MIIILWTVIINLFVYWMEKNKYFYFFKKRELHELPYTKIVKFGTFLLALALYLWATNGLILLIFLTIKRRKVAKWREKVPTFNKLANELGVLYVWCNWGHDENKTWTIFRYYIFIYTKKHGRNKNFTHFRPKILFVTTLVKSCFWHQACHKLTWQV